MRLQGSTPLALQKKYLAAPPRMHIQNSQKKLKGSSTICFGQWVSLVIQQSAAAIPVGFNQIENVPQQLSPYPPKWQNRPHLGPTQTQEITDFEDLERLSALKIGICILSFMVTSPYIVIMNNQSIL